MKHFESEKLTYSQQNKKYNRIKMVIILMLVMAICYFGLAFCKLLLVNYDVNIEDSIKDTVMAFNEPLKKNKNGSTNILLVGTGNESHEGKDLTDSIIIVNINKNHQITMLSIPRDLYIETSFGGSRVNRVYEFQKIMLSKEIDNDEVISYQSMLFLTETLTKLIGEDIHYFMKINFDGFKEVVNAIGGVDILVKESIYDPYYPKDGTHEFELFSIKDGMQNLDGETALKYVRSRKTTSDFSRSQRQQEVLVAIKNKLLANKLHLAPFTLKSLYSTFQSYTLTNLSFRELLSLAALGTKLSKAQIKRFNISDDPTSPGGFLYTPEREYYGGAYVLIPYGNNYKDINTFFNLITNHKENLKYTFFQVLNGTFIPGYALKTKYMLNRYGFDVIRYGNPRKKFIKESTIYVKENSIDMNFVNIVNKILPIKISTEVPAVYLSPQYQSEAQIIIEIGEDFENLMKKYNFIEYL